ncbi:hypothetical protein PHYPO_G00190010 [Pangasianodon hypophthalmus]|uniref:C-type lectin domain-containing protein n=1 Tax=Pangasianodon hypophthalmus TaxID=310915 RepID=A0A5N5PJ23_PANHP|nr:hypothetical protein PHYPO_G00190010 [Pangasianodon hypophthalmus]
MMMTLFQLLLFTGIVPFVLSASRKYYLIQEMKTWHDAQAYCRATHTDLAIIKSLHDMVHFQNEAQRQSFNTEAWIGLYNDINSWRWSFNSEPLRVQYWILGQPDNVDGHEECGATGLLGWFDASCDKLKSFLCFDARNLAPARYIYISELQMTWYDAQSYCRQHYTDLAIINDLPEGLNVQSMLPNDAWLGLFRDSWKWIDETNMSTLTWGPGQPDNMHKNENCGFVTNSQAADAPCSDTKPFFCYAEISERKQTVRLKIQFKQNVIVPAVKAAILEKIKLKLMEYGMAENTTVKWIEQPGGVVFHKEERNNNDAEYEPKNHVTSKS